MRDGPAPTASEKKGKQKKSGREKKSASAAVSTHPYGFLGLCKMYPKVITHSSAIPELGLCEDTNSWPNGCWHLPGHVLDRGMGFLMGR